MFWLSIKVCSLVISARHSMTKVTKRQKKTEQSRLSALPNTHSYNDEKSRSTVCFHLVSGWPEARYDILLPVKALRNSKHRKQNVTSSRCYNSLCESMYKCIHVGMNTESRHSADRGKQVLRQEKGEPESYGFYLGWDFFLPQRSWLVSLIHAMSCDWSPHREVFKPCKRICVLTCGSALQEVRME